jgi:hypothetical protein
MKPQVLIAASMTSAQTGERLAKRSNRLERAAAGASAEGVKGPLLDRATAGCQEHHVSPCTPASAAMRRSISVCLAYKWQDQGGNEKGAALSEPPLSCAKAREEA